MKSMPMNRRNFLRRSAAAGVVGALAGRGLQSAETAELPFANGERPLVEYPQKRPLLRLTTRPPQLETPFSAFNEGVLTPNDAFFVRYHLTNSPPPEVALRPGKFRLAIKGVKKPISLSIAQLKSDFEPVEIVAVNQCSGNSRGFSKPRVPGGQSGHGMMGNARWKGVRLKDVLRKGELESGSKQVTFDGLDTPLIPQTPDFVKALDIEHALDGEVMLAYEMNGEDLPWLNGYPLRLVVPGYYGTYWVKHLNDITVIDKVYDGYWMNPAYRIPDNECACVPPGTKPDKTVPIGRLNVRSFITSVEDGAEIKAGENLALRGIAFDGSSGIRRVEISTDAGKRWKEAALGKDLGKYSFREWTAEFRPNARGQHVLLSRATTNEGKVQPLETVWNPAGYMRNVVETVTVNAV